MGLEQLWSAGVSGTVRLNPCRGRVWNGSLAGPASRAVTSPGFVWPPRAPQHIGPPLWVPGLLDALPLFSLGSRKLDDWLPATTTSCTWEVVSSPIPTYYFLPSPESHAVGQPPDFWYGDGGPHTLANRTSIREKKGGLRSIFVPVQMLPSKILLGAKSITGTEFCSSRPFGAQVP